jgi:hypothetical protein
LGLFVKLASSIPLMDLFTTLCQQYTPDRPLYQAMPAVYP